MSCILFESFESVLNLISDNIRPIKTDFADTFNLFSDNIFRNEKRHLKSSTEILCYILKSQKYRL